MHISRRKSRIVKIGSVSIGGRFPIAIQSMTKTKTSDIERTLRQISDLKSSGCEIARLAVRDDSDAAALKKIKQKSDMPLVADIHFSWKLAIKAIESGVDKIRLNPGNIYRREEIQRIVSALKRARIPVRIGVNSGSVRSMSHKKIGLADRLVKSARDYLKIMERMGFYDIVISLKASNIIDTIDAYRKIARVCDYPLHLGVTATGSPYKGAIKSSIALGDLLLDGIGDTIRISLTAKPQEEVRIAKIILESLGLRSFGPDVISCPTCGRCEVDLVSLVKDLEDRLKYTSLRGKKTKIALMGCVVNGPGEAKEADIGVAFGKKEGLLFKKGKVVKKVSFGDCINALLRSE